MPVTIHNNENLKNAAYCLEEHVFINCKLTNCRLFYDGGPHQWENCSFENCQWSFRGAAENTVEVLVAIGMLEPGLAARQLTKASNIPVSIPSKHDGEHDFDIPV
jgi:hypothetical protein